MTLQQLLDELRHGVLRDNSDATGGAVDRLWTDDSLIRYLNDGYTRFAKETLLLRDRSTPALTQITLVSGQDIYPLDPLVLSVLKARLAGKSYDLKKATQYGLNGSVTPSTGQPTRTWPVGPDEPRYYSTDGGLQELQVFPVPSDDFNGQVLNLTVTRLPLLPLTTDSDSLSAELEMPSQYHLGIVEWAAYMALRNHDADAENLSKASAHRTRFDELVAEGAADARKMMFAPLQWNFNNARW